jgi:polysaccharide pyruvyl transferase WcaK-like protein
VIAGPPKVGLFGMLGSGNIGNDASLESMLRYLRTCHPDAILDAMCSGPDRMLRVYGLAAIPLNWYSRYEDRISGPAAIPLKVIGKFLDAIRIGSWVRRHDMVIVPGMGVLETTLPVRAFGVPYAMFLVCVAGRIFGTKVALVSVGANVTRQRLTRWLFQSAARLAFYRSYRDRDSLAAMRTRHPGSAADHVYPDLAFGIPVSLDAAGDPQIVGIGVMDFHGSNDDRRHAREIYQSYVEELKHFIAWLVEDGRQVRLFVGDAKGCDDEVIGEIQADLRIRRPDLDHARITSVPLSTFADLMQAMAPAGSIVATRYHNVICALMLCKPTISIGYAAKHHALMADMSLPEFSLQATSLDVAGLIERFTELQERSADVRLRLGQGNAAHVACLAEQFAALSARLFPGSVPAVGAALPTEPYCQPERS